MCHFVEFLVIVMYSDITLLRYWVITELLLRLVWLYREPCQEVWFGLVVPDQHCERFGLVMTEGRGRRVSLGWLFSIHMSKV